MNIPYSGYKTGYNLQVGVQNLIKIIHIFFALFLCILPSIWKESPDGGPPFRNRFPSLLASFPLEWRKPKQGGFLLKQDIICPGPLTEEALTQAVEAFLMEVRPGRERLYDYYRSQQPVP